MHIIFGNDNAQALDSKYTVLELDTFNLKESKVTTPAYCIIENVGITELPTLEYSKNLHAELIASYGKQNWDFCLEAISHLIGRWGGEVDSFYQELRNRINEFKKNPPGDDWSPAIDK